MQQVQPLEPWGPPPRGKSISNRDFGLKIAVIDGGFVYIGQCVLNDGFLEISPAKNIRVWGTTRGLGELTSGPTSETILDDCGFVICPFGRIIHFIDVDPCAWERLINE